MGRNDFRSVAGAVALTFALVGWTKSAAAWCVPSLYNCMCTYQPVCPVKDIKRIVAVMQELQTDMDTLKQLSQVKTAWDGLMAAIGSGGNVPIFQEQHAFSDADPVPMRDVLTQGTIDKLKTGSDTVLKDTEQRDAMLLTLHQGDVQEAYARALQAKAAIALETQKSSELTSAVDAATTVDEDWKANSAIKLALAQQHQDILNLLGLRAMLQGGQRLTPKDTAVAIQAAPALAAPPAPIDVAFDNANTTPVASGSGSTGTASTPNFKTTAPVVAGKIIPSSSDSTGTPSVGAPILPQTASTASGSGAGGIQANAGYMNVSGSWIGTRECAVLVEALAPVGRTSTWRQGPAVQGNTNMRPGEAIATFTNGRYMNEYGLSHTGFYESQNAQGIQIFDQYKAKPAGLRTIPWHHPTRPTPDDNNAVMYYVLTH